MREIHYKICENCILLSVHCYFQTKNITKMQKLAILYIEKSYISHYCITGNEFKGMKFIIMKTAICKLFNNISLNIGKFLVVTEIE